MGKLTDSRITFNRLYELIREAMKKGEEVWVEIKSLTRPSPREGYTPLTPSRGSRYTWRQWGECFCIEIIRQVYQAKASEIWGNKGWFIRATLPFFEGDRIRINPIWIDYLIVHRNILKGFTIHKLNCFLARRNPNFMFPMEMTGKFCHSQSNSLLTKRKGAKIYSEHRRHRMN